MSFHKPRETSSSAPDLVHFDPAILDGLAAAIKADLVDMLRKEPNVGQDKIVLLYQFALYEHICLDDVFTQNVLTPQFRAGIEDILKIFRTLNRCPDRIVRKQNINDRAEMLTVCILNSIRLAREFLRDNKKIDAAADCVTGTNLEIKQLLGGSAEDGEDDEKDDEEDVDEARVNYWPQSKKKIE